MKPYLLFAAIVAATALSAAAQQPEAMETYTLEVGEFSRLKVSSSINVDYRCNADSAGLAVFTAPASLVSVIALTNDKDELKVSFNQENPKVQGIPTLRLYSNFLSSVENSGDSTVRVLSAMPGPSFTATLVGNGRIVVRDIRTNSCTAKLATGNGQIVISGVCDKASLRMTGTGTIQADALQAETVMVRALGTGSVGCWARQALNINGMGSTSVYYRGDPKISKHALGVKVEPLP